MDLYTNKYKYVCAYVCSIHAHTHTRVHVGANCTSSVPYFTNLCFLIYVLQYYYASFSYCFFVHISHRFLIRVSFI